MSVLNGKKKESAEGLWRSMCTVARVKLL